MISVNNTPPSDYDATVQKESIQSTEKIIILAITNPIVNNITMLPPTFQLSTGETIVVHYNPLTEMVKGKLLCNFDYHFDFNVEEDLLAKETYPDRYKSFVRKSKTKQALELTRIVDENNLDLIIPTILSTTGTRTQATEVSKYGIPASTHVIVKDEYGALGASQALVPSHQLNAFLANFKDIPYSDLTHMFPEVVFSGVLNERKRKGIVDESNCYFPGDVSVSEYLPNVKSEHRILVSGNELWIRPRALDTSTGYQQILVDRSKYTGGVPYSLAETVLSSVEIATLKILLRSLEFTYGSIDIFHNDLGEIGVFEYCHQFGFSTSDPSFIRKLSIGFVEHEIHNWY